MTSAYASLGALAGTAPSRKSRNCAPSHVNVSTGSPSCAPMHLTWPYHRSLETRVCAGGPDHLGSSAAHSEPARGRRRVVVTLDDGAAAAKSIQCSARAVASPGVSSRHRASPGSMPFSCARTSLNCSRVTR